MSHTITITVNNVKLHISSCQSIKSSINDLISSTKNDSIKTSLLDFKERISNLENEINSMIGQNLTTKTQTLISTYEKEIANIRLLKENLILDYLTNDNQKVNIINEIAKHGVIIYEALDQLENEDKEITQENLDQMIQQLRNVQLSEIKRKEYLDEAYQIIDNTNLPSIVKFSLKNEIRNCKTLEQISDIQPLIYSKEQEYLKMQNIKNDLINELKKLGFTIDKSIEEKVELDTYSNIVTKFRMKNSSNNNVAIILNSDGQIKYKLGNYVGHMCNQTTEKLLNQLKKEGYDIKVQSIKRDIHNNKPLEMERELK